MLRPHQSKIVKDIEDWVTKMCEVKDETLRALRKKQFKPGDAFIGYHEDIIPSILLSKVGVLLIFCFSLFKHLIPILGWRIC